MNIALAKLELTDDYSLVVMDDNEEVLCYVSPFSNTTEREIYVAKVLASSFQLLNELEYLIQNPNDTLNAQILVSHIKEQNEADIMSRMKNELENHQKV